MRKNVKTFAAGLVSGALIFAVPAMANEIYENISVVRNTIGITIDGQFFDEDNFVYNDTTYVPLRAVAETFGKGVEYDAEGNIAKIITDCSLKFSGNPIGKINDYVVTDEMYEAYKKHLSAINEYESDEELDAAVKESIEDNVLTMITANALGFYIDNFYVKNFDNMLAFMYMQNGGKEEFDKKVEEQGYTQAMFRHSREVNDLKSKIFTSEAMGALDEESKNKAFDEIIKELKGEIEIVWDN